MCIHSFVWHNFLKIIIVHFAIECLLSEHDGLLPHWREAESSLGESRADVQRGAVRWNVRLWQMPMWSCCSLVADGIFVHPLLNRLRNNLTVWQINKPWICINKHRKALWQQELGNMVNSARDSARCTGSIGGHDRQHDQLSHVPVRPAVRIGAAELRKQ